MTDDLAAPRQTQGEGFVIRAYQPGDGPRLAEAHGASYEHLRHTMPWARPDQTADEAEALVARFVASYAASEDFVLGIFAADDGRQLGGTGFHLREGPLVGGCAEIGMWIRADRAGTGLGTAVLVRLLSWGFDAWPWRRLSWRCNRRNVASRRVAEKAGMILEGILRGQHEEVDGSRRDTCCYAALAEEWRPRV